MHLGYLGHIFSTALSIILSITFFCKCYANSWTKFALVSFFSITSSYFYLYLQLDFFSFNIFFFAFWIMLSTAFFCKCYANSSTKYAFVSFSITSSYFYLYFQLDIYFTFLCTFYYVVYRFLLRLLC